jgi:hypothetical protein
MKMKRFCLAVFAAMYLVGVTMAQSVSYNYDQKADFARYKTYKWVNIEGATAPDQLLDQDIKQAIDTQLASKGLTKAEDGAQLFIAYQVSISQEKQITTFNSGGDWGYGAGWGGGWGTPSISTATSSTINIGNLVLDMYDSTAKALVWRGEVSKTLSNPKSPEKRRQNINKAMAKLLKNYPPTAKK